MVTNRRSMALSSTASRGSGWGWCRVHHGSIQCFAKSQLDGNRSPAIVGRGVVVLVGKLWAVSLLAGIVHDEISDENYAMCLKSDTCFTCRMWLMPFITWWMLVCGQGRCAWVQPWVKGGCVGRHKAWMHWRTTCSNFSRCGIDRQPGDIGSLFWSMD